MTGSRNGSSQASGRSRSFHLHLIQTIIIPPCAVGGKVCHSQTRWRGSAHIHNVYSFKASENAREGNSIDVVKGTAIVTMKHGPVSDVPITIKVFNNTVIEFWIEPDKIDEHFGTHPVYGVLSAGSRAAMQEMHSMVQGMSSTTMQSNQDNVNQMSARKWMRF